MIQINKGLSRLALAEAIMIATMLPATAKENDFFLNKNHINNSFISKNISVPNTNNAIVFIDHAVQDIGLLKLSFDSHTEVHILKPNTDGIQQIASILKKREKIDSIHIISHGDSAVLRLGNSQLKTKLMKSKYKNELATIGQSLSEKGDILIYGCNYGAGTKGQQAVRELAKATGADIAASDDKTGAIKLNGDWLLEVASGKVESKTIKVPEYTATLDITITDIDSLGDNPGLAIAYSIFGDGIEINSATYHGGPLQAGTFSVSDDDDNDDDLLFGNDIIGFREGAIFSTGIANTVEGPANYGAMSKDAPGVDDNPEDIPDSDPNSSLFFDDIAGGNTEDASWVEINFTPLLFQGQTAGDVSRLTIDMVFGSEEYNDSVYLGVNDVIAIIVNGKNKAISPNGVEYSIDTINDAAKFNPMNGVIANDPNPSHTSLNFESSNPSLYRNNSTGNFNTQMNGLSVTIPVTFDITLGEPNTIKIGIADTDNFRSDSWLFIRENTGQTIVVAEQDFVNTPTDVPYNINVIANDFDLEDDPLTVTKLNGHPVSLGDTITLPSGVTIKLEELDGTVTVTGDASAENSYKDIITYEVSDGKGKSSTSLINLSLIEIIPPVPTITVNDITEDNILNNLESNVSVDVTGTVGGEFSAGDTVTLIINGTTSTGTINAKGEYSIPVEGSDLAADLEIDASVISIDAAGNEGTAETIHTHTVDITLPIPHITIDDVTTDNIISAAESQTDIDITGTVAGDFTIGDTVTLVINGKNFPTTIDVEGHYSVSVPGTDLVEDTIIDASITTTDNAGNEGTAVADHTHTVDTTLPVPTITIDDVTTDNILSATESQTDIDITGTVTGDFNAGDTVTLVINGKNFPTTIDAEGHYSVSVPGADLVEDTTIDASITTTDNAGNEGTAETIHTYTVDITLPVPTIIIDDVTTDNIISAQESESNINITGTVAGDFTTGDTVTLTINENSHTGTVTVDGLYSISVNSADLVADTTIDASITTTDTVGNEGTAIADHTHSVDTTLPVPTITVNDVTTDNIMSTPESKIDVDITGTVAGDFETGDKVTLSINGNNFLGDTTEDGSYSINVPGSDLIADPTIDASITTEDTAGNIGTGTAEHTHTINTELPVPIISIDDITTDNIISVLESQTNIDITGTVTGDFKVDDKVTLSINDKDYLGTVNEEGKYTVSVPGIELVSNPTINASVTTENLAGNTGTGKSNHSHTVDESLPVPTITVNDVTADNILSALESPTDIKITGVVAGDFKEGDTVTLLINKKTFTGTINAKGGYTISVPGTDLVADLMINASITTEDLAGNIGIGKTSHTHSVNESLPVPIITVNNVTADNILSALESSTNIEITGIVAGDFKEGDTVTLLINKKTFTGIADAKGGYTISVPGTDLVADLIINASITTEDLAGNIGTGKTSHTHTIDASLPVLTITVNDVTADNILSALESPTDIEITGIVAGDFKEGDTVTLLINKKTFTGTVNVKGGYTINVPGTDLKADSTIDASVTTTNSVGNVGTATTTHTHIVDTKLPVPIIVVDKVTIDNTISVIESRTDIDITGTVSGDFNKDDTVILLLNDIRYTNTVAEDGSYTIRVKGADLAADSTIDASVTTEDSMGNTATGKSTHTHLISTAAPTIPTVVSQVTADKTPIITGTATAGTDDTVSVIVGGATYTVTPDANHGWSIDTGTTTPISGIFTPSIGGTANDVTVTVTDTTGNTSTDITNGELIINALKATPDFGSVNGIDGGQAIPNVLANDKIFDKIATLSEVTLTQKNNPHNNIVLNTTTGAVEVEANTPEGTYTLEYEVCDANNATHCKTATVTITVLVDNDLAHNIVDIDSDNDGIPDAVEQLTANNNGDTDGDGQLDENDLDSDGDGLSDLIESGLSPANVALLDPDGDGDIDLPTGDNGLANMLETDDTPTAQLIHMPINTDDDRQPDFQDLDSDNDSIHDIAEGAAFNLSIIDANNDGVSDSPTTITNFLVDTDSDGIPDYRDIDSDQDGIPDLIEAGLVNPSDVDTDYDGLLDNPTLDSDNDGIPDSGDNSLLGYGDPHSNLSIDSDKDGQPNYLDLDSDNDSIPDVRESGNQDDNSDSILDPNGTTNPIPNDTDNDGIPDYLDIDSDNDGENDIDEVGKGNLDPDNDGVIDNTSDTDQDGIPNIIDDEPGSYGAAIDTDYDGVKSNLDLDDDNDGIPDIEELDDNGNDIDTDGDGIVDRLDRDSDNDGIPDTIEAIAGINQIDMNFDGVIDDFVDTNKDGLHDFVDENLTAIDTDNDLIKDFRDLDSDNDKLLDLYEASKGLRVDSNGDGKIDAFIDVDRDGFADIVDTKVNGNEAGISLLNPDLDSNGTYDYREVNQSNLANAPATGGTLKTAVSGSGGSVGIFGGLFMMLLFGLKHLRRFRHLLKQSLPLVLVALFISPMLSEDVQANDCSASAQADGFTPCYYLGGGIVSSHVDPEGEANGWSTSDSSDAGYNLYGGYQFKPHWFAEMSYIDMGEAMLENSFAGFSDTQETISYKVPSLHLGYLVRDPDKQLNFYGKAGVSLIKNEISDANIPYEKQTDAQLSLGLGAQWQAQDSPFFARLGVDFFDKDAITAGLNVGYKFGSKPRKTKAVTPRPTPVARTAPKPAPVVRRPAPKPKPVEVDTDDDGYLDKDDRCPRSKKGVVVDRQGCEVVLKKPKPSFLGVLEGVNFHTSSDVLTPRAEGILRKVAKQFAQWPNLRVSIIGHTDSVGSGKSNSLLSHRRAQRVNSFLVQHGVKRNQLISARGMGENQPRATNKTQQGRAKNRRVELLPKSW